MIKVGNIKYLMRVEVEVEPRAASFLFWELPSSSLSGQGESPPPSGPVLQSLRLAPPLP